MNNFKYSIVISTHNGSNKIANSISSLKNLDFDKDRFEILVVDDGSTDNTTEIVNKLGVRIVHHNTNLGLAAARNTGLANSIYDIYVCFDDDCVADKYWLREIDKVYRDCSDAIGVGGYILENNSMNILDIFLNEISYGNPLPKPKHNSTSMKFISYLKTLIYPHKKQIGIYEVSELAGGNSSFKIDFLKTIGGWGNKYSGIEDLEVCNRSKRRFNGEFYINSEAKLKHDHTLSIIKFLKEHFNRSPIRLEYLKKNNLMPPLFPLPIFLLLLVFGLIFYNLNYVVYTIMYPIFVYPKWTIKTISQRQIKYIFGAYIQLLYESSILFGMLKGLILR